MYLTTAAGTLSALPEYEIRLRPILFCGAVRVAGFGLLSVVLLLQCVIAPCSSSVNGTYVAVAKNSIVDARHPTSGCRSIKPQGMTIGLSRNLEFYANSVEALAKAVSGVRPRNPWVGFPVGNLCGYTERLVPWLFRPAARRKLVDCKIMVDDHTADVGATWVRFSSSTRAAATVQFRLHRFRPQLRPVGDIDVVEIDAFPRWLHPGLPVCGFPIDVVLRVVSSCVAHHCSIRGAEGSAAKILDQPTLPCAMSPGAFDHRSSRVRSTAFSR